MQTDKIIQSLLEIIGNSDVEEDIYHARDMLNLAKTSKFKDKDYFIIACVAHDIERSLPCRLRAENFRSYDEFKKAHEKRSGEIVLKILERLGYSKDFSHKVSKLVSKHEYGDLADEEAEELKFLDALSFLKTNAVYYAKRHTENELEERIRWGLKRLDERQLNQLLHSLKIDDKKVIKALKNVLKTDL